MNTMIAIVGNFGRDMQQRVNRYLSICLVPVQPELWTRSRLHPSHSVIGIHSCREFSPVQVPVS
ncbi:hypothetical protein BDW75DRAFT_208724 [Aspergillus navahoensis]